MKNLTWWCDRGGIGELLGRADVETMATVHEQGKDVAVSVSITLPSLLLLPRWIAGMPPPKRKQSKLAPKRHHWWTVLIFILGTLFPPLGESIHISYCKE
jgi:hypothetical protein